VEHKLIQGGEQYLPFARSRIKALLAAGLEYASQRFVFPDGEVAVRIVADEHYITLTGTGGIVLSGIIREGTITTPPSPGKPYLSSFKPTEQAWLQVMHRKPIGGGPTVFSIEKQLAILTHSSLYRAGRDTGVQGHDICGSMYSGKMAKLVQLLMGYGKPKSITIDETTKIDGVQVKYDYRWNRSHGVVTADDGKPWLVEISNANGVIAMPLPMTNYKIPNNSSQDVLIQAKLLFGGLPSGATFKNGTELEDLIEEGSVVRLMLPAEIDDFYSKSGLCQDMGWSFNDSGSEAHNMAFYTGPDYRGFPGYRACHYKLDIAIGATVVNREAGTPAASCSASLTLVEEKIRLGADYVAWFSGGTVGSQSLQTIPLPNIGAGGLEDEYPASWPVYVCHINNTLEVIRCESMIVAWQGNTGGAEADDTYFASSSPRYPANPNPPRWQIDQSYGSPSNYNGVGTYASLLTEIDLKQQPGRQDIIFPRGARDCYVVVITPGETTLQEATLWAAGVLPTTGLPVLLDPLLLDDWITTVSDPEVTRDIVFHDGTVVSTGLGTRATVTTESGKVQAFPAANPSTGTFVTVTDPPIPELMSRSPSAEVIYIVRNSSMGIDNTAIYSFGTDWGGRSSSEPFRAHLFHYRGLAFDGVSQPLAGHTNYSFIGYI